MCVRVCVFVCGPLDPQLLSRPAAATAVSAMGAVYIGRMHEYTRVYRDVGGYTHGSSGRKGGRKGGREGGREGSERRREFI